MSSTVFEVVLRPDTGLRRLVQISGIILLLAGLVLIFSLRIDCSWRAMLGLAWLIDCLRELRAQSIGAAGITAVILDSDGNVLVTDNEEGRRHAELMGGSLVLPGIAWIRLQSGNGRRHAELFTRARCGPVTWHRLQLLWHQGREAFGHPRGP